MAAEGSKPPFVRLGISLSTHVMNRRATIDVGLHRRGSPFHRSPTIVSRQVNSPVLLIGEGSHASSIRSGRVVTVREPTVSRPELAPGRLPDRWGDFPHADRGSQAPSTAWIPSPRVNKTFSTRLATARNSVRESVREFSSLTGVFWWIANRI